MRGTKSCWCVLTSESKTVRFFPAVIAVFFAIAIASAQTRGENPREVLARAVSDFERGRVVESAAGFDNLVKLVPDSAPNSGSAALLSTTPAATKTVARNLSCTGR